jgi:hypothetical protein
MAGHSSNLLTDLRHSPIDNQNQPPQAYRSSNQVLNSRTAFDVGFNAPYPNQPLHGLVNMNNGLGGTSVGAYNSPALSNAAGLGGLIQQIRSQETMNGGLGGAPQPQPMPANAFDVLSRETQRELQFRQMIQASAMQQQQQQQLQLQLQQQQNGGARLRENDLVRSNLYPQLAQSQHLLQQLQQQSSHGQNLPYSSMQQQLNHQQQLQQQQQPLGSIPGPSRNVGLGGLNDYGATNLGGQPFGVNGRSYGMNGAPPPQPDILALLMGTPFRRE